MPRPLNHAEEATLKFVLESKVEVTPGVIAYALTIQRHVALAALELLSFRHLIETVRRRSVLGQPVIFYCAPEYKKERGLHRADPRLPFVRNTPLREYAEAVR